MIPKFYILLSGLRLLYLKQSTFQIMSNIHFKVGPKKTELPVYILSFPVNCLSQGFTKFPNNWSLGIVSKLVE